MQSEEKWATAKGITYKKFGEVRPRSFQVMQVDRQTDTQNRQPNYNTLQPKCGKVITVNKYK